MTKNEKSTKMVKREGNTKHLFSFAMMILLTAAAFYLVAFDIVPKQWILPLILFFALIQVLLQLFTFMHLNQKGSAPYVLFIFAGLLIAVVSAVGIIFL